MLTATLKHYWIRFWMHHSGPTFVGRVSTQLATMAAPPYKRRCSLASMNPMGFTAPSAIIDHGNLRLDGNVYVGDRCVIYDSNGGAVVLGKKVQLYGDVTIETGEGGSVTVGAETHIQPGCVLSGYAGSLKIGRRVEIAPHCAFYPYNHGIASGESIRKQALVTKGGINIGDDAWLGVGVIVLDGVTIGNGAVIGAGSVVTKDIPVNAVACGTPARVIKMRG